MTLLFSKIGLTGGARCPRRSLKSSKAGITLAMSMKCCGFRRVGCSDHQENEVPSSNAELWPRTPSLSISPLCLSRGGFHPALLSSRHDPASVAQIICILCSFLAQEKEGRCFPAFSSMAQRFSLIEPALGHRSPLKQALWPGR